MARRIGRRRVSLFAQSIRADNDKGSAIGGHFLHERQRKPKTVQSTPARGRRAMPYNPATICGKKLHQFYYLEILHTILVNPSLNPESSRG
ncbi:MAG: hypothetical protein LBE09_00390 [Christensenellaceae bacterium]|nr:hypothetical protein [Christensenellaceae bacterium]